MWSLSSTFYCLAAALSSALLAWFGAWATAYLLAKKKGHSLSVVPFSLLRLSKFSFHFGKGFVTHLGFDELRIFRNANWSRTIESWFQDGLFPLYLGGATMSISLQKLRGKQLHKAKAVDVELQKKSSILNPFVQKVMLNWMSGLIMWVLPRIPISIHDVHLHIEDLGLSIVIPEIALLFHKHKQPSRLGAALTITEIKLRRDGVSDQDNEAITVGKISNTVLDLTLFRASGGLPCIELVDITLGEVSVAHLHDILEVVVELAIKVGKSIAPKRVKDKAKSLQTQSHQDRINMLPTVVSVSIPRFLIDIGNQNTTSPVQATLSLDNLWMKSEKQKNSSSMQAQAGVSSVQIKLGVYHDDHCAVVVAFPKVTTEINIIEQEGEIPMCIAGAVDVQGLSIVVSGEALPLFLSEGIQYMKKWESKLSQVQISSKHTLAPLTDEIEVIRENPDDSKSLERSSEKSTSTGDPSLNHTGARFASQGHSVTQEHGDLSSSVGRQGKQTDGQIKGAVELEPASLQLEKLDDSLKQVSPTSSQFKWNGQVKISRSVSFELLSKGSDAKFIISAESVWAEASQDLENFGYLLKTNIGLSCLKIQLVSPLLPSKPDGHINIVALEAAYVKATASIPSAESGYTCEIVLGVDGTVKDVSICLSASVLKSLVALAEYYIRQLAVLEELVFSKVSQKKGEKKGSRHKFKLGSWTLGLENIRAKYITVFVPVGAYSAAEHEETYTIDFSIESLAVEPWEHWTGGQSIVQNIKLGMYPHSSSPEQGSSLLSLHKLHAKLEDRGGTHGVQIIGSNGISSVKIDYALIFLSTALELGSLAQRFAELKKSSSFASKSPKEDVPLEPKPGNKMSFNLCFHDMKVGIAIGGMDHVSAVILEAHTDTRAAVPRVYVKQVEVFMNDSELIVSKHLSLTVNPSMSLRQLQEFQQNSGQPKRSTIARSKEKEHTTEVCAVPEIDDCGFEHSEFDSSSEPPVAHGTAGFGTTRGPSIGSYLQRESGNVSVASTMGSIDFVDEASVEDAGPIKSSESHSTVRRRKALANLGLLSCVEQAAAEQNMNILQIEMEMDTLCVTLPHNQHIGRLIMFTELWVEAAKKVIADYINQLKKVMSSSESSAAAKEKTPPPALVEVCIKSNNLSFRVEPHPFEAWMALNGRLLRSIVMQRQVWQSAIDSALTEEEDPGHERGSGEAAKEWIMRKLFSDYYEKSAVLRTECAGDLHHRGALMSVISGPMDAMILVGEKSNSNIFEACVKKIREIDKPSSDTILFSKAQPIYLDAKLSTITAHFGGLHAADISEIGLCGPIVRGRQLTHQPKLETAVFKVGDWHKVPMDLPLKGARPPMKGYTQLIATLNGMKAQASIGLEPIWAQMAGAFNRLTPPSEVHSDGRLKDPAPGLQPWDKMRYSWRGSLGICIRQMKAAFGASVNPVVTAQSDRVELDADELDIQVKAGEIDMHAVGLQITMFMAGLRSAPEQELHVLPLGLLPNAVIKFKFDWKLPKGRNQLDHYAFPRVTKPDPQILMHPIDLTKDFVGEGYTFSISAKLDGDMGQVDKVADVPQVTLGSYFAKKKKKNTVGLELPNLLHRLEVSSSSGPMEVKHHTLEADDPSSDMLICCEMVRFAGTWAFLRNIDIANSLRVGNYRPEPRWKEVNGVWRRAQGSKKPPDMEILEVEAFQIQGFLPDKHATNPLLNRTRLEAKHNSFLVHLLKQKPSTSRRDPSENLTTQPTGTEGHILSASCFWLRQLGGASNSAKGLDVQVTLPSGRKKRPIKIMMEDVKVLVPVEVRNAILGIFMHMSSAFSGPPQGPSVDLGDISQPAECVTTVKTPEQQESSHNPTAAQVNRESSFVRALLEQEPDISTTDSLLAERSSSLQLVDAPPAGSKLVLELEFMHVQLGLVSDISEGAVLLTLDSGQLLEHLDDQNHIRTLGLNVDHVQCYAMDTSIDPLNPVRWLEVANGSLALPSDSTGILSTIVKPFRVQMSDTHLLFKAQALNPGRAAEELKLKSPHIEATTESGQFEILVDVINSVATPPLPHISLLKDRILGASISALEDANEEIQEAKRMLRAEYVDFNAKRQEVFDIWCASGEGFTHSLGNLLFATGTTIGVKFSNDSGGLDSSPGFSEFIKSFAQTEVDSVPGAQGEYPEKLFYSFLNDQIEATRMRCLKSAMHLSEARKENEEKNKHKKLFKSMSMSFGVEDVSWTLRRDGADFMQAQLKGVTYSSFQNKDLSGESKVSVQGMCLVDTEGALSATPGLNQGIVLSALNAQGPGEEILRGLAVRGGQTSSHVYYEHIEVWVHPLGLHFTERLAREVAAYFFGADEADLHKEQEEFVRGVEHSSRTLQRVSSLGSNSGSEGEGFPESSFPQDHPQPSGSELPTLQRSCSSAARHSCQGDPLESLMEIKSPIVKARKQKGLSRRRKVHFVHVRFNKVTTRITYDGRPFPISNLDIIIRMNEYNNVIGHFHDILRKYRNNCITSVLKSAGGFLSRRYDPDEDLGEVSGKKKKKGMKDRLISRIRKGKSSIVEAVEGVVEGVVDMATNNDELQKEEKAKKMILGEP